MFCNTNANEVQLCLSEVLHSCDLVKDGAAFQKLGSCMHILGDLSVQLNV